MIRRVIQIDEEKCNGCGKCVHACHEGAIGLVDGKARLMREHYCDGLGDCLPACPTGAITFEIALPIVMGIAIGAGADVALDAADVVLMKSRLSDVPSAIRLSRATLRNIHQNLFWAFFYNTLGIPLAAGVFVPLGLTLNPMFGAAAMSLSSFCVVSNALRLNLFKLRDPKHDHKHRKKPASANTAPAEEKTTTKKEKETMKKTMKIEGMMCAHCEATVKKALEAVEDKDYKVLGIE